MKKIVLSLFLLITCLTALFPQTTDTLESLLESLPGVRVKKIEGLNGYRESFLLYIKQPVNHQKPDSAYFWQRVWLSHRGFDRPVVFITEGYSAPVNYASELSELLGTNQIIVEHRFFGKSVPDSLAWSKLNLYQQCQDLHHVRQLLGRLYHTPWISTGISKGGQTTIAYKFFFPSDVKASVPYVAPFTFSKEDPRVIDFIEHKVGTDECRQKVITFQREVLRHKKILLPLFIEFARSRGMTFEEVGGYESGFEHGILEFSFSFWQWGYDCNDIPRDVMHTDSTMAILEAVNPFDFFSDQNNERLRPYYYQALTEMGIYTYDTKPFEGLLKYANNPHFDYTLRDIPHPRYSSCLSRVMFQWLTYNGNNMVYIYGGYDPWGACSMIVDTTKVNALKLVYPTGSHRTRIRTFDSGTQRRILDSLSRWTGYRF